tara:strand:+ start:19691 stop:19984 length:294 start_codon:yes stop_codon:yes gene_type:complete
MSTFDSVLGFKKSVHIKLNSDTHSGFRISLFEKKLSMQETFEEFASRVSQKDPVAMKIIDELVDKKRKGRVRKAVEHSDASSLFDIIESQSPLRDDL